MFEMASTVENKEGWVVTFANGKMAKIKTKWYMSLHSILTDGLKEHKLVRKILEEEIDDILAQIPPENTEERDFINDLTEVVVSHVNGLATEAYELFNDNFDGDRKAFAMKFKEHKLFRHMTKLFRENSFELVEKSVVEMMFQRCFRLEKAKAYLKDLGFEREIRLLDE